MEIIKPKLPATELRRVFKYAEKHSLRPGLADYSNHIFYFYSADGTELRVSFEEILRDLSSPQH